MLFEVVFDEVFDHTAAHCDVIHVNYPKASFWEQPSKNMYKDKTIHRKPRERIWDYIYTTKGVS